MIAVLRQLILLVARYVPESIRPFLGWVADLVGDLKLPAGDPRMEKVAVLIADLLRDIEALADLPDADARDKARLILENRFGRAWIDLIQRGGA